MKKDKDDIVVDLSAADESLKNLSKEDQAQMKMESCWHSQMKMSEHL